MRGGFTGVDIFFAISGYLIGGHIFADLSADRFGFLDFYRLRARRILPAFIVLITVVLAAGWLLLAPNELLDLGKSTLAATLSASNLYFWKDSGYFETQNQFNPLLMTWSLGIEEQFYATIPVLMLLFTRFRCRVLLPAILAFCAISFLAAWTQVAAHPILAFYLTPLRAWELGAGVALAVAQQGSPRISSFFARIDGPFSKAASLVGALLILAPIFLLTADSTFPGPAALPSVLGAALLIATASSWINRRLLSSASLVFVGRISYSWYLWHWPLLALLRIVAGVRLPVLVAAAAVLVSFLAAVASYYLIEQPFRRSRSAPFPLLVRYALLSLVFIAAGLALWKSHGFPARYPQLAHLEGEISALHSDPCLVPDPGDTPNASPPCSDPPSDRPAVALWGDSHSAALAPGLRPLAHQAGYDFLELSKAACRPVEDPSSGLACSRFNRNVLRQLQANTRIRVVVITAAWGHLSAHTPAVESLVAGDRSRPFDAPDSALDLRLQFLNDAIASLQDLGKKVMLLEDVPSFETDPAMAVWTSQIPLRRSIARFGPAGPTPDGYTRATALSANEMGSGLLQRMAVSLPALQLVDLRPAFCATGNLCAYQAESQPLYLDNQHLSPEGARFALRNFHLPNPQTLPF